MTIERYIKRRFKHTAVYWAVMGYGGDGSPSYTDPVEISCLWVERLRTFRDDEGREVVSRATVYVSQDLTQHGLLYLGTLDDLSSAQEEDPHNIAAAQEIMIFSKKPSLYKQDEYNREAIL